MPNTPPLREPLNNPSDSNHEAEAGSGLLQTNACFPKKESGFASPVFDQSSAEEPPQAVVQRSISVTVIGTGYVGLVTGTCLAQLGHRVMCLDIDQAKVALLQQGQIPIHEPGLSELVLANVAAGRLSFSADAAAAAKHGQVQFIAVGTPPDEDGSADLQYVLAAAKAIAQHMDGYRLVINKSTVPVGTADLVSQAMRQKLTSRGANFEFSVASNPEFLREGHAVTDCLEPDRVVVGVAQGDERALGLIRQLYAPLGLPPERLLVMDVASSELTKYATNAMLATRISFMNELANLAESLGADIDQVRLGLGSDQRIGPHFLLAGCGYGGSCFPKDVQALLKTAANHHHHLWVVEATERANEHQKQRLVEKIEATLGADLAGLCFAVWGLAFKPDTDDMREASSRVLIRQLLDRGAQIQAYDPVAQAEAQRLYQGQARVTLCPSANAALDGADALVILTEWQEFRQADWHQLRSQLPSGLIFDGRNLYSPAAMRELGLNYQSIGRGQ